jgi:predicted DNA-binding protein with PD1-like motif
VNLRAASLPDDPVRAADAAVPWRRIVHPGPAPAQPVEAAAVAVRARTLVLPAGLSLRAALTQALDGEPAAVLRLGPASAAPFAWVLPARSQDGVHAVFYSARHESPGPVTLHDACVSWGRRDGEPWLHVHADWTLPDGTRCCGHLLPDEVVLAAPMTVQAWCLDGAGFEVQADAHTGFSLFRVAGGSPVDAVSARVEAVGGAPVPTGRATESAEGLLVRLAPNVDVCASLVSLVAAQGWRGAVLRGGVGSTVGAVFTGGRVVEPFITEAFVTEGRVAPGADGALAAAVDVRFVEQTGGIHAGRLAPGRNGVLVTFEMLLERVG